MWDFRSYFCSSYITNLKRCYAESAILRARIAELEAAGRPEPPCPVVQDKDKTIWSGVKMGAAVARVPECKLLHYGMDGRYWLANKDIWKLLVAWDWVDSKKYIEDIYDCENFAILFKGRADYYFGLNSCAIVIDYSSGHGYNMIFYPDGSCDIFEPQNDAFISVIGRNEQMYGLQEGAILI